MDGRLDIRMPNEERELLEAEAQKRGYKSASTFARKMIELGIGFSDVRKIDGHLLAGSMQSVFLLREILKMLSPSPSEAEGIISKVRSDAVSKGAEIRSAIAAESSS